MDSVRRIRVGLLVGTLLMLGMAADPSLRGRSGPVSRQILAKPDAFVRDLAGIDLPVKEEWKDWTARMVDPAGDGVSIGADALLVTPWTWDSKRQQYLGSGATIYSLDGAKRAHVLGKRPVYGIVIGRRAFVTTEGQSYSIVSTKTGKILRTVRHAPPAPLVGSAFDFG